MDYEKYREALERARKLRETCDSIAVIGWCEYIFPELKNEDELTWLTRYIEEEAYSLSMDIRDDEDRTKLKKLQKALAWLKKVPVTIDIDKMVDNYANNKEPGNEVFGKPVPCMVRAYRQGLNDAINQNIPRYNIGDVLCDKSCTTLNKEEQPNFEITDIRNGMYICDKGSFPISQQDEYELVAKRIEQNKGDEMKKFNVLRWDFNHDELIHYDVLPYFRNCYKDRIKKSKEYKEINENDFNKYCKVPKTLDEFKKFIEDESRYQFWSRCEYEMICHGWPVQKTEEKLDIHDQVMMNIDIISEILYNETKGNV